MLKTISRADMLPCSSFYSCSSEIKMNIAKMENLSNWFFVQTKQKYKLCMLLQTYGYVFWDIARTLPIP